MPVRAGNPLSITAADVQAIGKGYKPGLISHAKAHDDVATALIGRKSSTNSRGVETVESRLAHWKFLIGQMEALENAKTSLCEAILKLFNKAFDVVILRYTQVGKTSLPRLPREIAGEMRGFLDSYQPNNNVGNPDDLNVERIWLIGSSYKPGFGMFHKPAHARMATTLKDVIEVGATPEARWGYLADVYAKLESHGNHIAVCIRRLCEEAFGSGPSTGLLHSNTCKETAASMRQIIQKHYHPGRSVASRRADGAQFARLGPGNADL